MTGAAEAKKRSGNAAEAIYDQLRADILSGKLAPGTPISQLAIASAHGTSRGPVKEALRQLQQDQLVTGRANQRFNVAPFDIEDFEGVLSLHVANLSLAIRASVPHLTDADMAQLNAYVDVMDKTAGVDEERWEKGYRDFALTLVQYTSPRTQSLVGHLIDSSQRHRRSALGRLPTFPARAEFHDILSAAAARDGRRAAAIYTLFMSEISLLILASAAPNYDPARLRSYIFGLLPSALA